jgi:hypothetical protein
VKKHLHFLLLLFTGIALWLGSITVRRAVLAQQTRTAGDSEAPFILEAALQYRMTREVYETGRFENFDPRVQYPDGVYRWRTYSIGAEFIYAPLARLLPGEWSLVSRLRWVSTALFCLAVPFAALWAGLGWKSWWAGLACGLILMVSPAFAVRSSGLALSRENMGIPLMTLFLLADQAVRHFRSGRVRLFLAGLAGVAAGLSQVFWDFSQYLFGLWALAEMILFLRRPSFRDERAAVWSATAAGLGFAALAHPYLRGQGFLFSPVMILCMGLSFFSLKRVSSLRLPVLAASFAAFAGVWTMLGRVFVTNYSHFGELFLAKLLHMNRKPFDPAVLSYEQRIMWTPALNSATWELTKAYFPAIFWLLLLGIVFLFRAAKQSTRVFPQQLLFYLLVTFPMYVLFFRMHVYLILFAAAAIGGLISYIADSPWRQRCVKGFAALLILFIPGFELYRMLFFEPSNTRQETAEQAMIRRALEEMGMAQPRVFNRWGHPGQSYQALAELSMALNDLNKPDAPVLAGFGVSGTILTDTGMPILLHPKFESPGIRDRVREFYEHLFLNSEKEFRNWASSHGAKIYVHAFGSLASGDPREMPRYMVDALEPPDYAAVHVLERSPRDATWFQPLWSNERYQIFRIITDEDIEFADTLMELAFAAARRGDQDQARRLAWRVLSDYHWKHPAARELIGILGPPRISER